MITTLVTKIIGTKNDRELKRMWPLVHAIGQLEPAMQRLTDAELRAKTDEFRQRLANGETLDDLLVEAFAVVREMSWRVLNMRHFDVQLIGGMVLHHGKIAEMKTREGKTLVATPPAGVKAPGGRGGAPVDGQHYLAPRRAGVEGPHSPHPGAEGAGGVAWGPGPP